MWFDSKLKWVHLHSRPDGQSHSRHLPWPRATQAAQQTGPGAEAHDARESSPFPPFQSLTPQPHPLAARLPSFISSSCNRDDLSLSLDRSESRPIQGFVRRKISHLYKASRTRFLPRFSFIWATTSNPSHLRSRFGISPSFESNCHRREPPPSHLSPSKLP